MNCFLCRNTQGSEGYYKILLKLHLPPGEILNHTDSLKKSSNQFRKLQVDSTPIKT